MPRPRRIVPPRQWRIDSDEPLPTGRQALDQPFSAFPSWLMKVTCDRCGQERIFAEAHAARQRDMLIRDILAKMRHDGCGGGQGRWSCSPASKASAAAQCARSCCAKGN